ALAHRPSSASPSGSATPPDRPMASTRRTAVGAAAGSTVGDTLTTVTAGVAVVVAATGVAPAGDKLNGCAGKGCELTGAAVTEAAASAGEVPLSTACTRAATTAASSVPGRPWPTSSTARVAGVATGSRKYSPRVPFSAVTRMT